MTLLSKFRIQSQMCRRVFYQCGFRRLKSTFLESSVSLEALDKAKPFEEIPGPKGLPILGCAHHYLPGIGTYSIENWHEAQSKKFYQYGPIVRELFPSLTMVHLYDPKDIETVTRNEGLYPQRNFFLSMKKMREMKPKIYATTGVAAGNGKSWHHIRSRSQKVLMKPPVVKERLPQINVIADDFIDKVRYLRTNDMQVPELKIELFKWALESVIYILFDQRFGCLAKDLPKDSKALKYIKAVNDFFYLTGKVELALIPYWHFFPNLSPSFRKLEKVHSFFFGDAMKFVEEKVAQADNSNNNEDNLTLMEQLLHYCTPQEAAVMAVDAMAAGIDTTALSVAYTLRHLAANPEVQKKLQKEVDEVMPNKAPMTPAIMENIPYLRACIKESMRLTPVVTGTSRVLSKDIVLSGYKVPANTVININYFVSSIQEENYPNALKYIPERWLRESSNSKPVESFAFQPFGFGPRMCIGRRIAEIEMFTLLSKIMQNFWIENKHDELDIGFQLVLMIKNQLKYEFHER